MARFPESWWRERPLVLAHRGASRVAPENTLAAFRRAAELGADGVELDVYLSQDGVPVVIHNLWVDLTTDGTGKVTDLPLSELRALDAGSHFLPAFAGERIPTLTEALEEVGKRLLVNIELKPLTGRGTELEAAVAQVVRRMGLQDRIWFSSFKPYSLSVMRRLIPEIPCGMLYAPPSLGHRLLALVTPYEALHPYYGLITAWGVAWAHRRGRKVAAWTVDDEEVAVRLAARGVDVLITNEPDRILAAVVGKEDAS